MAGFADHFSGHADAYSAHRPRYPEALFRHLVSLTPGTGLAWDCACGNGQASGALAEHFGRVFATDASAAQIEHAEPHERVEYGVAPAESCPLDDGVADLVTVAQAAHWLDLDRFYAEATRVLRPGGVLAIWGYGLHAITPEIDAVVISFYERIVGPYWPPQRRFIDERYRTLPFPYPEHDDPGLDMRRDWTLEEFTAYVATWSAVQRYRGDRGEDPIALIRDDLAAAWGDAETRQPVTWPLFVRAGLRPIFSRT